jgi:GDP-4-dehydro-6-deoxy-D-mannose reductase
MRVLITGVTGFAGRHLAAFCAARGATVVGFGRSPAEEADAPAEVERYEAVDLSISDSVERAIAATAPDRVFHLAAASSVAESWRDPLGVMDANVRSTLNLLEAVRRNGGEADVLVACSGEEYGQPMRLPVTEDHPLRPQSPYALSKAASELAAGFYADAHELRVTRTRAFNHTGPGQSDTYVVSSFARQIAQAEASGAASVEIVTGNVDVRRDFSDVRDVVHAYWLALEHGEPDTYNVCSGRSSVVSDILAALSRQTSLRVEHRTDPALIREHEVMEIRGSHDKLTRATGWQPEIQLERTLRDTLDWWREQVVAEVPG